MPACHRLVHDASGPDRWMAHKPSHDGELGAELELFYPRVPFVLLYRVVGSGERADLIAECGLTPDMPACPATIDLSSNAGWPMAAAARAGVALQVDDVADRFPGLVCGEYPEPIRRARCPSCWRAVGGRLACSSWGSARARR
jgi:hypothetical protein